MPLKITIKLSKIKSEAFNFYPPAKEAVEFNSRRRFDEGHHLTPEITTLVKPSPFSSLPLSGFEENKFTKLSLACQRGVSIFFRNSFCFFVFDF